MSKKNKQGLSKATMKRLRKADVDPGEMVSIFSNQIHYDAEGYECQSPIEGILFDEDEYYYYLVGSGEDQGLLHVDRYTIAEIVNTSKIDSSKVGTGQTAHRLPSELKGKVVELNEFKVYRQTLEKGTRTPQE